MPVKEYQRAGKCEIHTEEDLYYTGDEWSSWYQCKTCSDEDWANFRTFVKKTSDMVALWPKWKGGEGKGILCPCCKGNQYVPQVVYDDYNDKR